MRGYSKYGETIRRLRKEKGWSQEKLAELAKVDPKTIIQIEGGRRNPTLQTLQRIANALNASLRNLIP